MWVGKLPLESSSFLSKSVSLDLQSLKPGLSVSLVAVDAIIQGGLILFEIVDPLHQGLFLLGELLAFNLKGLFSLLQFLLESSNVRRRGLVFGQIFLVAL